MYDGEFDRTADNNATTNQQTAAQRRQQRRWRQRNSARSAAAWRRRSAASTLTLPYGQCSSMLCQFACGFDTRAAVTSIPSLVAPTITTMGTRGNTVSPSAFPALAAAVRDSASLDEHAPVRDRWRSDGRGETATFGSTITRPWADILGTGWGGSRATTSAATDRWCRVGPHVARRAGAQHADEGLNGCVRGGPAGDVEDGGVIRELVVPPDPPSPTSANYIRTLKILHLTNSLYQE